MQANRSKNTKPELMVRAELRARGLTGYRIHWKGVPGHPDVCFVGRRVAIFVHGCFWHRCPHCTPSVPKSHTQFWEEKFARNRARDARDNALLVEAGWTVLVVWECRLKPGCLDQTMEEVVCEVHRAAGPRRPGRLIEVGSPAAWRLGRARERLGRRR
jgi:DNA mismatch endonuclease (patch repair protein)